jgi:hypothetical protein
MEDKSMISMSEMVDIGQRWMHRLVDRVEDAAGPGSTLRSIYAVGRKQWPAPAFFIHLSSQAKALFTALNSSASVAISSGRKKISTIYDGIGQHWTIGDDRANSKAWGGKRRLTDGKWSTEAFHLSLSNVGHLAGGIVNNYSASPENRHPFVKQVVKGRSSGRYDDGVFSDVRQLLKRDDPHHFG